MYVYMYACCSGSVCSGCVWVYMCVVLTLLWWMKDAGLLMLMDSVLVKVGPKVNGDIGSGFFFWERERGGPTARETVNIYSTSGTLAICEFRGIGELYS